MELNLEEIKQRNKKYQPLLKVFQKNKLKEKDANVLQLSKRMSYFRGDDFMKFTESIQGKLQNVIKDYYTQQIQNEEDAKNFGQFLLNDKVIVKCIRGDDETEKKFKYPKKLLITLNDTKFEEKAFYLWNINPSKRMTNFLMALILIAIAGICLFPVWPIILKIGIFYFSVVMLYVMVGFVTLRLVVYGVFRIFGVSIWILPNLFEDVTPAESFKPLFGCEKQKDGWGWIITRLVLLTIVIFVTMQLVRSPQIVNDATDMGTKTFNDIIDWGKDKIEGKDDPNLFKRAIPNLSDIMDQLQNHTQSNVTTIEHDSLNSSQKFSQQTSDL